MSRWGGAGGGGHEGRVIIDPEMGAFGDNGCIDFIKTEWDTQLDKGSLLPGTGDNIKLRNFGCLSMTRNGFSQKRQPISARACLGQVGFSF